MCGNIVGRYNLFSIFFAVFYILSYVVMMLLLLRMCLMLPWTVAAPLNQGMDDDRGGRDGMHSHTSPNTNRDGRFTVQGGNIHFSGSIDSSKDYGQINIGSISSYATSREHQTQEHKSGSEVQGVQVVVAEAELDGDAGLEQEEVFPCSFNDELLAAPKDRDGQLSPHDTSASFQWENNLIPYFFTDTSDKDKKLFRSVMDIIEEKTCFIFEEKTKAEYEDKHSLEIEASGYSCMNGCYGGVTMSLLSDVLKLTSMTKVNDREDCELQCGGFILHELMHVLGVGHTQRRSDRDQFIIMNMENVKASGLEKQFEICTNCTLRPDVPYDCDSMMHYATHYGGKELFKPKDASTCKLNAIPKVNGGPKGSDLDWKLLNIIGKCSECVTSPGYPNTYPDNAEVERTFSVKDGKAIEITFDYFDVEFHEKCSYDYLKFVDANKNAVGEKMCGSDLPEKMTISTSAASALFVSDGSVNMKGYKFCYKPIDSSEKCVTSPGYPNHYPDNSKTNKSFSVSDGHNIEITFHHFDVEFEETCSYDYLQFEDAHGKKVGKKLCGKSLPEKLTISTSSASAQFSSDQSENKTGYKFCYKQI